MSLTPSTLKQHATRHPFCYQDIDHMRWRWQEAARCLDKFNSVSTSRQSTD